MRFETPDVEKVLTEAIRDALLPQQVWTGLYVGRSRPDPARQYVVTVQRAGGTTRERFIDQARLLINVWAPTERDATWLADEVRSAVEAIRGHGPVIKAEVSGPSAVTSKSDPPQRFMSGTALLRRSQKNG